MISISALPQKLFQSASQFRGFVKLLLADMIVREKRISSSYSYIFLRVYKPFCPHGFPYATVCIIYRHNIYIVGYDSYMNGTWYV